jgi:hypothetical protein
MDDETRPMRRTATSSALRVAPERHGLLDTLNRDRDARCVATPRTTPGTKLLDEAHLGAMVGRSRAPRFAGSAPAEATLDSSAGPP